MSLPAQDNLRLPIDIGLTMALGPIQQLAYYRPDVAPQAGAGGSEFQIHTGAKRVEKSSFQTEPFAADCQCRPVGLLKAENKKKLQTLFPGPGS